MTRCTDPQQWATVPGADSPEEDVARYLAHLEECAFHAAIEQRETAQLRSVVAFAGSELGSGSLEPGGPEAEALSDRLDLLGAIRRNVFIRTLSIRVDGSERCRLNLLEASCLKLEVEERALIGVWQPAQSGEAEELYLTTYVLHTDSAATGGKSVSSTVLEGGQRISFTVERTVDSKAQLTVAYTETRPLRSLRLSLARLRHRLLAHRAQETSRSLFLKLSAGLLALLAVIGLLSFLLLRNGRPTQIAKQSDAPTPVAVPPTVEPAAVPSPSIPQAPNINGSTPTATTRNTATVPGTRPQMSLAKVRRVYVGTGEGDYHQRLRAAVIAQLRENGRFTVVASEQEADAVLLSELTRGAGVRVQLLNREGKPLWFTTQPTAGESNEDVSDTAAKIVRELSNKAKQRSTQAP